MIELAAALQAGADAIREKRRLRAELAKVAEERDRWQRLAMDGVRAQQGMVLDLVMATASGRLKVDKDAPLPDRLMGPDGEDARA